MCHVGLADRGTFAGAIVWGGFHVGWGFFWGDCGGGRFQWFHGCGLLRMFLVFCINFLGVVLWGWF